jgi:hypothetical protein
MRVGTDQMKSYGTTIYQTGHLNGELVFDLSANVTSTYTSWHTWIDSPTVSRTIQRTGSAQSVPVRSSVSVFNTNGGAHMGDLGSGTLYLTVPALDLPAAPTGLAAAVASASQVNLSWAWSAQGTYAQTFDVFRSTDGGAYVMVGQGLSSSARSWQDTGVSANHTYAYQVKAWNARGWSAASNTATARTATAPSPPSNVTNTRGSDNRNSVAWTRNATALGVYASLVVQRQVDGGAWSALAELAGAATSYVDTTTQPNHAYAYRVAARNITGQSAWAASDTTRNTPAAPGTPVAARTSAAGVLVTFANPGVTETGIEWQRSTDGSAWGASTPVAGADITSFTDSPGGGKFYYRVRNTLGVLTSPWSAASGPVVTIAPPAAPTLTSPASGAIVPKSQGTVRLAWRHNPVDGSAQTAAQLRHSTDGGGTWTVIDVDGSAQSKTVDNAFAVNATVTWQARTKGAHADFGPWSSSGTFRVLQVPQATITSPASPVEDVPIAVAWAYSDQSGYQVSAKVSILDGDSVMFSRDIKGPAVSTQVSSSDFLPTNGRTYTIQVLITSSSSLTALASVDVLVDYEEPPEPSVEIEADARTGAVSLYVTAGSDPEKPLTTSLGVFRRRSDGTLLSIADKVASGAVVVDRYPPLDQGLAYVIAAYSESGTASQAARSASIDSKGSVYINFGEDLGSVAKLGLDRQVDWLKRHDGAEYHTAGKDPAPIPFYGYGEEMSGTVTATAWRGAALYPDEGDPSSYADVKAASDFRGSVILRRPMGGVIPATIECSFTDGPEHDLMQVSVSFRRVRGSGLVI